jgi:tetratricopeptide (TPR) repeat protein
MTRNPAPPEPHPHRRPLHASLATMDAQMTQALDQARRLTLQGRHREALAICLRLVEVTAHPDVLGLLGALYARNGQLGKALEQLAHALLLAPRNAGLLYELSQVYLQAGAPAHALHSLQSYHNEVRQAPIARDYPDVEELISTLATFMAEERGLTDLSRDTQDRVMMAAERGRLRLLFNGDPEKAMPELRDAIRLASHYAPPRNNLALAYFFNGQPDLAVSTLEATLREVSADNVYALATLAFVRWALGDGPGQCLPGVTRAAGLLTAQSRLLDRIRVAEVAGTLGAHEVALAAVPAITEPVDPSDPLAGAGAVLAAMRLRATAMANLGRTDEAQDLLRDAPGLALDPLGSRLLLAVAEDEPLPGGAGYPYLRWDDFVSTTALRRTLGGAGGRHWALRAPTPPPVEQVVARIHALLPRLTFVAGLLLWMGEPALESLGLTLLALADTPAADVALEAHLRGRLGSYGGRQEAGYALLDSGRLLNGTAIPFWSGTAWSEIRLFRLAAPGGRNRRALYQTLGTVLERIAAPDGP